MSLSPCWTSTRVFWQTERHESRAQEEVTFVNHDKLAKSVNQEGDTKLKEKNFSEQ